MHNYDFGPLAAPPDRVLMTSRGQRRPPQEQHLQPDRHDRGGRRDRRRCARPGLLALGLLFHLAGWILKVAMLAAVAALVWRRINRRRSHDQV